MAKDFAHILRIKNTTSLAQTVQKCMILVKHLNTILVILNNHSIQLSDTASMNKKCLFNTAALLKFYFIKSSKDLIYTFINKSCLLRNVSLQ